MQQDMYTNINLPSRCRVYEGVSEDQVKIRTLKGKDEKLIAELTIDNAERKFVMLMRNLIQGIDPMKLTLGDRQFIILWEAINSFSTRLPYELQCSVCTMKSDIDVDLTKIEYNELPEGYSEPYEVKLSDGTIVKLRSLTVEDEIKVMDLEKGNKNTYLYKYALGIVDENRGVWDNVRFLEELNVRDLAVIRQFYEKFYHGPIMKYAYTCPNCGAGEVAAIPFQLDLLLPSGETIERRIGTGLPVNVPSEVKQG